MAGLIDAALRDLGRGTMVSAPNWQYEAGLWHMPNGLLPRVAPDTRARIGREDG